MEPLDFLIQQVDNVELALVDTLRFDYGPERTRPYYDECAARLSRIKAALASILPADRPTIRARLDELSLLALWISLIERSHLGEFSWPFAEELRKMAKSLLAETNMIGLPVEPIIHVIAAGEGYQIVYEELASASSEYRFAVVEFPRPLKHHVLLHVLFGHELGHTALHTNGAGRILQSDVMGELSSRGPLSSSLAASAWLNDPNAPNELRQDLQRYASQYGSSYVLEDYYRQMWLDEFVCDLFGLLLFGPGFAAAHQVFLNPTHPNPFEISLSDPTHPPYATRHKMLVRVIQLVGWHKPVTDASHGTIFSAESDLLNYVLRDPYMLPWASPFDDQQLMTAIRGVQKVLSAYGPLGYTQPAPKDLVALIERLAKRLPPILADIATTGRPILSKVEIAHTLYAGWVYWCGRSKFPEPLSFLRINKLCDHALLQQQAINTAMKKIRL